MATLKLNEGERMFTEIRTATFRKEQFDYIHTGIIDSDGETWTTTNLDEANINQVWNQYRVKHGIPFPDEIIRLREYYGLSAAKMAGILGLGINQYRYYENGEVPNESNARIIIAIRDKNTFKEFLDASRDKLGEREYHKINKKIESLGSFQRPSTSPDTYSGYVSYDVEKVRTIVLYLINRMGSVFVTKMNKLLFYCDFLSYRRTGFGMTGLKYIAMQYGPVPENWGKVYDTLNDVEMNECILPNQSSGIRLESTVSSDTTALLEEERRVLDDVCIRFSETSARDISMESHKEKGWINNSQTKGNINYKYAFDLSMM
ncbi:MAG: DUF4065 domain-containing protein [Muribaculum sp.]|nr:DUF4065 domain-containing protein [Muribaculum sp.]